MIINKLKIKNYRKIRKLEVNFENGINIVIGDNEAGKSTIMKSILDGFFLNALSKNKEVKDNLSWGNSSLGFINIEFVIGNKGYEINKDFLNSKITLYSKQDNKEVNTQNEINSFLKSKINIASKTTFQNTSYISQNELALLNDKNDLKESIERLSIESNENVSVSKITKYLNNELRELNKGSNRLVANPGKLIKINEEINTLKLKISDLEASISKSIENKSNYNNNEIEIKRIKEDINILEGLISNYRKLIEANDKIKILNNRLDEIDNKLNRVNELIDIEKKLKNKKKNKKFSQYILFIPIILGLILSLIFSNLIILLPFLLIFLFLIYINTKKRLPNNSELIAIESEKSGILINTSVEDLVNERKEIYREIEKVEINYIDNNNFKNITPIYYSKKNNELERLQDRIKKLETKNIYLTANIDISNSNEEELNTLKDELIIKENELEELKNKERIINLVIDGLNNSIKSLSYDFKNIASKTIEKYLSIITDNKYSKVNIDEELNISVFSNEKNEFINNLNELSRGTIDQIYFVFRLALLKIISGKESIPIILDDTFVSFDKKRLNNTKKLLDSISNDTQIIIFTHNKDFSSWGNTINLI